MHHLQLLSKFVGKDHVLDVIIIVISTTNESIHQRFSPAETHQSLQKGSDVQVSLYFAYSYDQYVMINKNWERPNHFHPKRDFRGASLIVWMSQIVKKINWEPGKRSHCSYWAQ